MHLILADGANLTVNNSYGNGSGIYSDGDLNIYGQSAGTGKLTAMGGTGDGICAGAVNISGGTVEATSIEGSGINAGNLAINGGQVSARGNSGIDASNVEISGGETNKYICAAGTELTLSVGDTTNFYKVTGIKGLTAENGTYTYTVTGDSTIELDGLPKIDGLTFNTSGEYYEIGTTDALIALASYVNAGNDCAGLTFKLTADLDLTGETFTAIEGFKGTFDGDGKLIVTSSAIFSGETGTISGGYYYGTSGYGFTQVFKLNLPENVEISGVIEFGGKYYAQNGAEVTISGFNGGEITFDAAITSLKTSDGNIIAHIGDDFSFTISGIEIAGATSGFMWIYSDGIGTYGQQKSAGGYLDGNSIKYRAGSIENAQVQLSGITGSPTFSDNFVVLSSANIASDTISVVSNNSGYNFRLTEEISGKTFIGSSGNEYVENNGANNVINLGEGSDTIDNYYSGSTGATLIGGAGDNSIRN